MKAAVYYQTGPPDVFRYEEVSDPPAFPGGVLVAVEAISIEGGDTLNRAGGSMTATPHIVGYQCAGTIVEVSFATGRALWGVGSWQWCQYYDIFEWRWRMKANNFSVGDHALHDDELVVADSGRAANIFVADGQPGPPWFNAT